MTYHPFKAVVVSGLALAAVAAAGAAKADDKGYVMKITLPTINEQVHQYAKELAARVEKEFGRPHQDRGLSGEPVGLDPAADRGHAVRLDPMRRDPA